MGTHDGTHMDAGYHFFADKPTLDQYPVDRFVGSGVVLDLRAQAADTPVAPDTLRAAIATADGFHAGDFALLWYGWDAHYGGDLMWRNPYLSEEAARLLVDAGVTLVGADTPNVDSSTDLPQRSLYTCSCWAAACLSSRTCALSTDWAQDVSIAPSFLSLSPIATEPLSGRSLGREPRPAATERPIE